MNNVCLIGNLARDPELRYTGEQMAVCRISVAVSRGKVKQNEPDADFINCIAFGKTAENISNYMHKGSKIGINGRLQTGNYIKNDEKRYYTDVVINTIDFCDSKRTSLTQTNGAPYTTAPVEDEDDLPF